MSSRVASRRWRLATRFTVGALVWSLGLLVAALLVPAYNGQTTSSSQVLTLTRATLVQVNGARALILVTIPVIVSIVVALAMYGKHRDGWRWSEPVAWAVIGLLAVEAVLGIVTIGVFILPVVILLALSVRLVPGPLGATPDVPPRGLATET